VLANLEWTVPNEKKLDDHNVEAGGRRGGVPEGGDGAGDWKHPASFETDRFLARKGTFNPNEGKHEAGTGAATECLASSKWGFQTRKGHSATGEYEVSGCFLSGLLSVSGEFEVATRCFLHPSFPYLHVVRQRDFYVLQARSPFKNLRNHQRYYYYRNNHKLRGTNSLTIDRDRDDQISIQWTINGRVGLINNIIINDGLSSRVNQMEK